MTKLKKSLLVVFLLLCFAAVSLSIWHRIEPQSRVGQTDPAVAYLNAKLESPTFRSIHFEHEGDSLHAVVGGNPEGEPLIFIHGFPSFWFSFVRQLEYFADDYQIIAIDGLGVNYSDAPYNSEKYRLQAMSDHLLKLLDSLQIDRFHLVGHDWGSAWSLGLAQKYPDRVKTVTGISAPPQNVILELVRTLPQQREKYAYVERFKSANTTLITLMGAIKRIHDEAQFPHYAAGRISEEELALFNNGVSTAKRLNAHINWYRANLPAPDEIQDQDLWPATHHQIKIPTLLIWGDKDSVFVPDYLAHVKQRGDQVEVLRFANAGHWPHLEESLPVNEAIGQHLLSTETSRH